VSFHSEIPAGFSRRMPLLLERQAHVAFKVFSPFSATCTLFLDLTPCSLPIPNSTAFLLVLLFYLEEGESRFARNVGKCHTTRHMVECSCADA
jgi:hypothetical protein